MNLAPITVVDLFAGCGGFTQGFREFVPEGFKRSPFQPVAAVESDIAAASTYAANFLSGGKGERRKHLWAADIKNWRPEHLAGKVDVILGGPPCQGFSGLGLENPEDPRNQLWREYKEIVKLIKPKVFIIENVDRFLRSAEYDAFFQDVEKPGGELSEYTLRTKVLNAADYGVPQRRRRVIVIATLRDDLEPIEHPQPTHRKRGLRSTPEALFDVEDLPGWVPVDSVFAATGAPPAVTDLPADRTTLGADGKPINGTYLTSELHIGRTPTALSLARYAEIPPGGNRYDLRRKFAHIDGRETYLSTTSWDGHNAGAGDVMGRVRAGEPSVTIRTEFYKPEKGRYLHPSQDRPLSHLEAALIQGFPRDFRWCGTKVQIARQIGNAVPVGLATAIAGAVYRGLRP
jgi:DNA (cytosine-5)-methyltransferase 1